MKHVLLGAALAAIAFPTFAADVGVSVTIGQPGFYGHIELGNNTPPPAVVYPQPVIIQAAPVGVVVQPIYLHVPPGHASNWARYCGQYNACGRPVYFVQDSWYNNVYVPQYQAKKRQKGGNGHGHGKGRGN